MSAETISGAELDAARLILARMGISPDDLRNGRVLPRRPLPCTYRRYRQRSPTAPDGCTAPTGTGSSADGRSGGLDEVSPSDIQQLSEHVRTHVVPRRNARGGNSAAEHLIAALRCLYNHAVADGLISEAANPARKVAKPLLQRVSESRNALCILHIDEGPDGFGSGKSFTPLSRMHAANLRRSS